MADPVASVKQLLHRRFRVTLVSGRVLAGSFQCLDSQGNLILANTSELAAGGGGEERPMGMVLVPLAQRKQVELQVTTEEKLAMLKLVDA
mmetsp:Transcript_27535/g.70124  ORF Transcript_27535/g.70124 Transcript_27535/m.70124 type:complete len:90 (+) Transcript_27535:133-402(+)|eukprot:CAMPEP_0202866396 /NCGR_PEP_ID=MMETSP1391-20130828/7447_1 /ASSEMBLY_ACC=CAM_ASM_000867 /TAXON_ID=1034604 /ORGANISM="Chlamydomonas leiostraca, Strain SAG 11-49" /LENGTH=89 /DNA_ID=CAMNT_0049546337 /DNA_START=127 /DNA_END=396 /DNA_ORIENTATION=+